MGRSWGGRARRPLMVAAAAALVVSILPAGAQEGAQLGGQTAKRSCSAPADVVRLEHPLKRTAARMAAREPLTIVAIGSSSTAGAGASSPQNSYPSRLEAELEHLYPGRSITVLNRGVNGEEANDMLARFETSVMAEKPDLVLWQVGTNSVLRSSPLAEASILIREGVRRLKASGADVVLVDPQFAPKVIAKPEAEVMLGILASTAKETGVDLFRRFAAMRHWHKQEGIPFSVFITPDDLHMNDWGYACVARLMAGAISEAINRRQAPAVAVHRAQ
ncbi:SGNH/GDSL hydrolase family protein [Xanthobacteraceae bacterium Astr-EGSB]|uniref:SGNH/GDSL hydrolase family protein n=1 Tax=Astrobacterium formosum TaxID=3069710 RepID=UPI0027B5AB80|nr:SGNH/GDSL hydrolase family protein [Xanthobacteraceae bacterium Astr-EGSB]